MPSTSPEQQWRLSLIHILDGITEEDQIIVNSLTGISLEEGMAVTAVPMEQ